MKKVALVILDGWGHGDHTKSDAIYNANTPFVDSLYKTAAQAELLTDGENVGLPKGQMGNSEVGHLNIGAGRILYQDLVRINRAIADGSLASNLVLQEAMAYAKAKEKTLHFIGLLSGGGVHASTDHLKALCDICGANDVENVRIHAFTDGRDTDPKSGLPYVKDLEQHLAGKPYKLASVVGRFYAMDRDQRWERIKVAYDLLTAGKGEKFDSAEQGVSASYAVGVTDEFIKPIFLGAEDDRAIIREDDVVICFNFRTDRCREITRVLTQDSFPDLAMAPLPLHYITMTTYDDSFRNVLVLFEKTHLALTIGEIISSQGGKQLRIAETEKYPHVTFFFSGNREDKFDGEDRIMIPSPKVATYDLQPEMSAPEVASAAIEEIRKGEKDFICLNFANADMVGHTGVYEAIVKAVETVDESLKKVVAAGQDAGYSFVIIADHGNADFALNPDGSPNTAHSTNPVPIFVLHPGIKTVRNGVLADVAPTILQLMDIPQPSEMTGSSLI